MAAIIEPRTHNLPQRPALRLVTADGGRSAVVPLELGLRPAHFVAAVAALLIAVTFAVAIGSGALAGLAPDGPQSSPSPTKSAAAAAQPGAEVVVVSAGDTLWSIARQVQPNGDVRPLVDELIELNGGGPIQPGDRIVVPA